MQGGRICVENVVRTCSDKPFLGAAKLAAIQTLGAQLAATANEQAARADLVERECFRQVEMIQFEVSKLALEAEELKRKKNSLQCRMEGIRVDLRDKEIRVKNATRRLDDAKRELGNAKNVGRASFVAGGLLGLFTFGVAGAVVGAVAGGGIAAAIQSVDAARQHVRKCEEDRNTTEKEVSACHTELQSAESRVSDLLRMIADKERGEMVEHEKAADMKKLAVLYLQMNTMATTFEQVCNNAVDRGALVLNLVAAAEKREEFNFLQSPRGWTTVVRFINAWKSVKEACDDAAAQFGHVTFVCTKCNRRTTQLPYLDEWGRLNCPSCAGVEHAS